MAVIEQTPGRPKRRQDRLAGPAAVLNASREVMGKLPSPAVWYLLAVIAPIGVNLGPLYLTGLRVYLLLFIVPLTIKLFTGQLGRILLTDILFFLHIGWATVAIYVNNPTMVIQNTGSAAVEFLGGYLVARAYIRTRADFIALCRWLGLAVCVMLPFALYETKTGYPIAIGLLEKVPGIRSVGNVNIDPRMGLQRVQAFFTHPIHFGLFCSTAFSLTVFALKDILPTRRRLLIGAAIAVCVFLSLSSGALLPMLLQIFLIIWIALFERLRQPWLLLGLLIALAYVVVDLLSNRTPMLVFFSYATFSAHNAYWRAIIFQWGMKNVWGSPIFGIGLNDWVRPSYMYSGSMDNFWLVMAVRYGIPGFLLVAAGYGYGILRIIMRKFSSDPILIQLRRGWMFTFVGLTMTLCTVHVWTNIYSFVFFMFGSGMWFISTQPAGETASGADPAADPAKARAASRMPRKEPLVLPVMVADGAPPAPGAKLSARQQATPADRPPAGSGQPRQATRYTRFPPTSRS